MKNKLYSIALFSFVSMMACTKKPPLEACQLVPKEYEVRIYEQPDSEHSQFFADNYKRCKIRSLKKNDNALLSVGISVLFGLGTQKNPMKAFLWFKGAADKGNKQAQVILAQMFKDGVGVPRDPVIAQKYLDAAAQE